MAARSKWVHAFALAACVALTGCDDEDGGTGPGDDVYGVWEADNSAEDILLDIQTEQIVVYQANELLDCHDAFTHAILDREGDIFTIQDGDQEVQTTIRREGDGLVIEVDEDADTYTWVGEELPQSVNEC